MNALKYGITIHVFCIYMTLLPSKGTCETVGGKSIFDYGFPSIQNYGPKEYEGHAQTWDITQSPSGLMYFGTSEGVLEFDGNNWRTIKLPNRTRVRSLVSCPKGRIYCGGANDLGYLETSDLQPSYFVSLKSKLPLEIQEFDQINSIVYSDGLVFFQTYDYLFIWNTEKETFQILQASIRFNDLQVINGQVWVKSVGEGYLIYEKGQLTKFNEPTDLLKTQYSLILDWQGDSLLFLFRDRMSFYYGNKFLDFNSEIDGSFQDMRISNVLKLNNNRIVLLTKKGLYFLSGEGKLLLHLNKGSGLADDNLKNAYIDREGALWVSSNFGLSRVGIHIPIKKFDAKNNIFDTVNDIVKIDNTLYVSTHTGLFKFNPKKQNQFENVGHPVPESFALEFVSNELWVSTDQGIFRKTKLDQFEKVCDEYAYKFQQSVANPNLVFVGSTEGLVLLQKQQNDFVSASYRHLIKNDIRYMNQDTSGILWMGTNDNKLFRVDFFDKGTLDDPFIKKFDDNDGLPVSHIQINTINNEIFFSSEFGVYEFDGKRFSESMRFPPLRSIVYYMYMASDQTVYVLFGEPPFMKIIPFERDGSNFIPKNIPELSGIESPGIWVVYEDQDDKSIWFGMTDGVLNFQPMKFNRSKSGFFTNLNSVLVNSDSIISGNINNHSLNHLDKTVKTTTLVYEDNSLKFAFGLPAFDNNESNRFQYKLSGLDDDWSSWSDETVKEYAGLFEGAYTFEVKGRNVYGQEGELASFHFSIRPPWYRTWWFIAIVLIIFSSIMIYTIRYISQRRLIVRVKELEMQQKIQQERERISSDLHDHVGAQLTSIISGLQVTEEIEGFKRNNQMKHLIDSLKEDAQTTMVSLRDSIWTLKNETITVDKFVEHIENYLESQLKYYEYIKSEVTFSGHKSMEIGHKKGLQLTRTIQEAIQNILKHAKAGSIIIDMRTGQKNFQVKISDNGAGFDPKLVNGEHFGLENMKRRIQEIGGVISIRSTIGEGTKIEITI